MGGPQDTLLCFFIFSDILMAFAVLQLASQPVLFAVLYIAGATCTPVGTLAAYGTQVQAAGGALRRCCMWSFVLGAVATVAAGIWISSLYLVIACAALQLYAQGWLIVAYGRVTPMSPAAIRTVLSQSALYTLPPVSTVAANTGTGPGAV
jgi:hypothetical protein